MPDPTDKNIQQDPPASKKSFLDTVYSSDPQQPPRRKTRLGDQTIEVDTDFGKSTYDESFYPDAVMNRDGTGMSLLETINENRARRQPGAVKALAGLGRVVGKVGTEIAKMPGYLGGAVAATWAEEGEGWDTFVNNAWINSVEDFSQDIINDELLPVYVKKAVKEGNLWDNITSIDFWATEGADGIGFMASMFVPGAAVNALKLGTKGAALLSKIGGKLDDVAAFANKIGMNPKNFDLASTTVANTMIEAAAEANSAGKSYDAKMTGLLESGAISQAEFDEGRARSMANVFKANMAILAGPNLVMSKVLWGAKTAQRTNLLDDAGKLLAKGETKAAAKKLGAAAGRRTVDVLKATGREGFFEEGLQSTAEEMLVGNELDLDPFSAKGRGDLVTALTELPEAYLDMINTTEGQKAIFLGGVLGGGMQVYTGMKQDQYDKQAQNAAIKALEKMDSFFKIYNEDVYNEEGDLDASKMSERLQALGGLEVVSQLYDKAHELGNQETIDGIHNYAVGELIKNFTFNPKLGLSALEEFVDKSTTLTDFADTRKEDIQAIRDNIMGRAKKLQADQNTFSEFSRGFINLKDNGNKKELENFYGNLNSQYVSMKNAEYHYKEKNKEWLNRADQIASSIGAETMDSPEAENNYGIQEALSQAAMYEMNSKDIKKKLNEFWKPEFHQAKFDGFVKVAQEEEAKQAEADRADIVKEKIDNATTAKELEDIVLDFDEDTNSYLKNIIDEKINNLSQEPAPDQSQDDADAQWAENAEASNQQNVDRDTADLQIADLGNWIADNFAVDESLNLSADQSPEYATNNGIVREITDEYVVVEAVAEDQLYKIPREKKSPATANPQEQYNTEGGKNHDANIPKMNENGNKDGLVGGTKLISYNRETNTVLAGEAYRNYELTPEDKTGKEVKFKINKEAKSTVPETDKKIKAALAAYANNDFSNPDLLIDYLPLNAVFADGVEGFVETRPKEGSTGRLQTFMATARPMRTAIVNGLIAGNTIDQYSTTVQGQNPGTLQVDTLTANYEVKENSVAELDFFSRMKSKDEKLKAIRRRIGYINQLGTFVTLDGKKIEINKPNSSGELYLMIPMANGKNFPLKLNVSRISEPDADILMKLYGKRFSNKEFGTNSRLIDVFNEEEIAELKSQLAEPLTFLNKSFQDVTIKDVTDFFVWDKNLSGKARIGFKEDKNGNRTFVFGETEIKTEKEFNEKANDFREWLLTEKRHQINIKEKKGQTNNATIATNLKYLEYLLDNKIINTNAVVGEPTFQGFAEIFLDQVNLQGPATEVLPPQLEQQDKEKPYDVKKIEAMLKGQKNVPVVPSEEIDPNAPSVAPTAANVKATLEQVALNKTFIVLNEDGSKYVNKNTGQEYERVTRYIEPQRKADDTGTVETANAIGNQVDELVRDFFAGNLQDLANYTVAETAQVESFIASLTKVKEAMDKRGETVIANDLVLYNDELGLAGTVDLLTYDKQGKVRIYDMKTMRGNQLERKYENTLIYDSTKFGMSNREKHKSQLNLYRILLNNTHGIKASTLGIMPIEVWYPLGVVTDESERLNLLPGIPVEIVDKVRDAAISSKKLEKTPKNIRNTNKNFVSSHEVANTPAATKVSKLKKDTVSAKPMTELTAEKLMKVAKYLVTNKLIKMDSSFKTAMAGTTKQQFIYLDRKVKQHNLTVENILKDCN